MAIIATRGGVGYDIDPVTGGSELSAGESTLKLPAGVTDLTGSPGSPGLPKGLIASDYYNATILAADATYLYGRSLSNTKQLVRYPVAGVADESAASNAYLFSSAGVSGIAYVMTSKTPGLIFVAAFDATATNSTNIWRSTDYGVTFTSVLPLGLGYTGAESTRIDNVNLLSSRSYLDCVLADGSSAMFIAEYNVNGSRTAGGINDRICVYKSTDSGLTWVKAAIWNSDGATNQIRHFHAIVQNPVTKHILIACGDSNAQSGIIPWDGVSALASNLPPSGYPGAKYGAPRYRCTDIVFEGAFGYYLSDADVNDIDAGEIGLWRFNAADLTGFGRIDGSAISECSGRWGFMGVRTAAGDMLFVEGTSEAALTGEHFINVYALNAARSRLYRCGVLRTVNDTALKYAGAFFESAGRLILSVRGASMHQTKLGTPVFRIGTSEFVGIPDVIHPAYWIDPDSGVDDDAAGRGKSPLLPYKTLGFAVQGGRLPFGAVVVCDWAGEKRELAGGTVTFGTTSLDATQPVEVRGRSSTETILSLDAASTSAGHVYVGSTSFKMRFRDIWWKTNRAASAQNLLRNSAAVAVAEFTGIRSNFGNVMGIEYTSTLGSQVVQVPFLLTPGAGGSVTASFDRCNIMAPRVASDPVIQYGTAAPVYVTAKKCNFFGGGHQVLQQGAGSTYAEEDCIHYGYGASAIRVAATADVPPASKRGVFSTGNRGTNLPQIVDETAGDITAVSAKITSARTSDPLLVTGAATASVFDPESGQVAGLAPKSPLDLDWAII